MVCLSTGGTDPTRCPFWKISEWRLAYTVIVTINRITRRTQMGNSPSEIPIISYVSVPLNFNTTLQTFFGVVNVSKVYRLGGFVLFVLQKTTCNACNRFNARINSSWCTEECRVWGNNRIDDIRSLQNLSNEYHCVAQWHKLKCSKPNYQPVSHWNPPNPVGQSHLNPLARSLHSPPLRQGLLAHSFISKKAKNEKCMTSSY